MVKVSVFAFVLLGLISRCLCESQKELNGLLVRDFINQLMEPIKITAMLCWNFEEKIQFNAIIRNGTRFPIGFAPDHISHFPNDSDEHMNLLIVDLFCPRSKELLASVGHYLYLNFKWILLQTESSANDVEANRQFFMQSLGDLPVLISSQIFIGLRQNKDEYRLVKMYRINKQSSLIEENYGTWNRTTGFQRIANSNSRHNLRGNVLRSALVLAHNESLLHLTDYKDETVDTTPKVNHFITLSLIAYLNATAEYVFIQNNWGYYNQTSKQWTGMVGKLITNELDLSASSIFFTLARSKLIQFVARTTKSRIVIVFRSPKLSFSDNIFLLSFDKTVWFCLLLLIILIVLILTVVNYISFKSQSTSNEPKATLTDTLLLILSAACQQGSAKIPNDLTRRVITILCFITAMFLYTCYSANIVALLQSPSTKIKTLEDLCNSRLQVGAEDTVYNRYFLPKQNDPTTFKLYEQKILRADGSENFYSLDEGIEKMRKGLFAFYFEVGRGYKVVSDTFLEMEKCGLQEIEHSTNFKLWYPIPRNSSMKELIKIGLFKINEFGISDREDGKLNTRRPKCNGGSKFVPVSLVDVQPAFQVFAICFAASFVVFAIEILVKNINSSDKMKEWQRKHFRI